MKRAQSAGWCKLKQRAGSCGTAGFGGSIEVAVSSLEQTIRTCAVRLIEGVHERVCTTQSQFEDYALVRSPACGRSIQVPIRSLE